MKFIIFVALFVNQVVSHWTLNDTIQWQVIGGDNDGQYVSSTTACADDAIALTTNGQDAKWTMQPVNVDTDDWGFTMKKQVGALTCMWHHDADNSNQIRAFQMYSGTYYDQNLFILIPINLSNSTFIIKSVNTDQYLYLNNVARLKGNGAESSAQGMYAVFWIYIVRCICCLISQHCFFVLFFCDLGHSVQAHEYVAKTVSDILRILRLLL